MTTAQDKRQQPPDSWLNWLERPGIGVAIATTVVVLIQLGVIGPSAEAEKQAIKDEITALRHELMDFRSEFRRSEERIKQITDSQWTVTDMRVWVVQMRAENPAVTWVEPTIVR